MTNFVSSFSQLMQSDTDGNSDSPKSLFDFINSHKSAVNEDEDIKSLSDLTSRHLNLKEDSQNVPSYSSTQLGNFEPSLILKSCTSKKPGKEASNEFSSLEEYTKSYLTSTGNRFQCRNVCPLNLKAQNNSTHIDKTNQKTIYERLSKINLSDSNERDRKIDLTAALLTVTKNHVTSTIDQLQNEVHRRTCFYPVKECMIDITSLAAETISYNNADLSHFGYVITRKWDPISIPRKCRRIGRTRPYNIAKSFKFDTPSPDDDNLKKRTRNDTI